MDVIPHNHIVAVHNLLLGSSSSSCKYNSYRSSNNNSNNNILMPIFRNNDTTTLSTTKSNNNTENNNNFITNHNDPNYNKSLSQFNISSTAPSIHSTDLNCKRIIPISDCSIFEHQVGGHSIGIHCLRGGLLKYKDTVLKPVNPKRKGQCEKDFYLYSNQHPSIIQSFIPKFHGFVYVQHSNSSNNNSITRGEESIEAEEMHEYIQLEDLTHDYLYPSIMDLKMGTQTYDEEASIDKIEGDRKKYIHQITLGMRVIGMKIHRADTGYQRKDKNWGKQLTEETIKSGLKCYFEGYICNVVPIVIEKLNQLLAWFKVQTDYRFYSSSLLILYESSVSSNPDSANPNNVRVCMVDFTHVYGPARSKFFSLHDDSLNVSGLHLIQNQKDEKYTHGLVKLIKILQTLLDENMHTISESNN